MPAALLRLFFKARGKGLCKEGLRRFMALLHGPCEVIVTTSSLHEQTQRMMLPADRSAHAAPVF